jgi:hypothetical protein
MGGVQNVLVSGERETMEEGCCAPGVVEGDLRVVDWEANVNGEDLEVRVSEDRSGEAPVPDAEEDPATGRALGEGAGQGKGAPVLAVGVTEGRRQTNADTARLLSVDCGSVLEVPLAFPAAAAIAVAFFVALNWRWTRVIVSAQSAK